jgi:hypothetical protein
VFEDKPSTGMKKINRMIWLLAQGFGRAANKAYTSATQQKLNRYSTFWFIKKQPLFGWLFQLVLLP